MSDFTDGDLSTPQIAGVPTITYPMPHEDPTHYVLHQPMIVQAHQYAGVDLDSPHPLSQYSNTYCVGDEQHSIEGRSLRFVRIFATLPKSGSFWDAEMVTFPRYTGITGEYEVVDHGGGYIIIKPVYTNSRNKLLQMDAAVRRAREYFIPGVVGGYETPHDVEVYPAAQPYVDDVFDSADGDYAAWVAKKLEIVVEPTKVERYMGNIWRAETTFTKAR